VLPRVIVVGGTNGVASTFVPALVGRVARQCAHVHAQTPRSGRSWTVGEGGRMPQPQYDVHRDRVARDRVAPAGWCSRHHVHVESPGGGVILRTASNEALRVFVGQRQGEEPTCWRPCSPGAGGGVGGKPSSYSSLSSSSKRSMIPSNFLRNPPVAACSSRFSRGFSFRFSQGISFCFSRGISG
jgi:hypothetical protein